MPETDKGHVLITGGAGYIGSTMSELLLDRGYEVTVLDRFFFGDTLADLKQNPEFQDRLREVRADIRTVDGDVFEGVDAVFDLAALSNDPSGELDPQKTIEINHLGRRRIARLAKQAGVERYVLASSCSIYGFQDDQVDETARIYPLTTYAEANGLAELSNLRLNDPEGGFTATALRQATVYGLSRRMRFDLVINAMVKALYEKGQLAVMRPGTQWRPLVHVRDTSRAFIKVLESDPELVGGEVFNVGSNDQNIQIKPLAKRLTEAVGMEFELEWYGDPDHRSYQVSFDKIHDGLGYETKYTFEDGAQEIYKALDNDAVRTGPTTSTLGWYKALLNGEVPEAGEVAIDGAIL